MKYFWCLLFAATIGGLAAQSVSASGVVGGPAGTGSLLKVNYNNFAGNQGGGEYGVYISSSTSSGVFSNLGVYGKEDFRTFCVELNEQLSSNDLLRVAAINTVTVASGKQLTNAAAWLYREFVNVGAIVSGSSQYIGSIGGASYNTHSGDSTNKNTDANLLQQALWSLMGWTDAQISAVVGASNLRTTTTNNKFLDAVALNQTDVDNLQGFGGVRILNLVTSSNRQDVLYYDSGLDPLIQPVPEPTSLAIFGMGIVGAAWNRRRQNRLSQVA